MPMKKGNREKKVYFSPDEWNRVCEKAEKSGMRVGTYIRKVAVNGEIKIVDMRGVNELRMEISREGNNINQVAHLANETQSITIKDIERIEKSQKQIKNILNNWIKSLWE